MGMAWKNEAQERYQKSTKGQETKKNWEEKNKQKRLQYIQEWARKNPARRMLAHARARAKKKGLECTITVQDIDIPLVCPVLGIVLEPGVGAGRHRDCSPSLDRIDLAKGYVSGNVRVISYRANFLKNNATIEEMESVLKYMKESLCESSS